MHRLAPALLVLALAVAGCSGSPSADAPATGSTSSAPSPAAGGTVQPGTEQYVALGDSFTAGPLIPTTDVAAGCFRSDRNYPALLAADLGLDLTDVSCSGADTADLVGRQRTVNDTTVPPQLRALRRGTALVTLGIGGNDLDLFSTLVNLCPRLRAQDPAGSPCADELARRGEDLRSTTARIGQRVADAVEEVQQRAPDARVVLVGYLRIAPTDGSCPRRLPFATGDLAFGDRVIRSLNAALAGAARRTGVEFLDMYAASEGHDVCSDQPWVNGRRTDTGSALAYHPFLSGMRAVADGLEALLRDQ
ncbi:SGNH/GDSL hydrolase family protein [Nocardioides mesophilus]|uniref:SGNH/GDSL hydrolase family protein n=1 Tax=Nocardioides mesophilus TaxID=433659 RepID=A0A7G9RE12_9ACTN|nr:SGNH/GDSL hydrolase family protein [Nocardioides mesophilus]QNN53837.1 SGNH/GDSL hydrolase family protein [Nocardioides mesophilus]